MKNIAYMMLIVILLVSCSGSPEAEMKEHLITISNVGSISSDGTSKAMTEGSVVEGVLLKFHSDGLEEGSVFTLDNPNAFYLEALETTKKAKNGMAYNYILYVPDCIKTSYEEGEGANPDSGNSLWWFLASYYGDDLSQVRGNWNEVLQLLLKNKDNLSYPQKENVDKNWKVMPKGSSTSRTFYRLMPRQFTYDPVNDTSYSGDNTYNKEFGYYHVLNERQNLHLLLYPNDIYVTYILNGGMGLDNPDDATSDALYWYLYTYYGVTQADVAEMIDNDTYSTFIDRLNADLKQGKKASGSDIPEGLKQIVSNVLPENLPTDTIELRSVYAYGEGNLILEDGTPVTDLNRVYCVVEDWSRDEETRVVIFVYLPKTEIESYETSRNKSWDGNNQPFHEYLEKRNLTCSNYNIPVETLKAVLSEF